MVLLYNFKIHLGLPLQWAVCPLHFIELPSRHLFEHLDGVTTGPKTFSGLIGQQLNSCEKLPEIHFQPIDCEISKLTQNF